MNSNIFDDFFRLTNKDIAIFFSNCLDFLRSDYNQIVQFYSGKLTTIDSSIFQRFEELNKEKTSLFISIQSHSRQMKDVRWWEIIEQLEEIDNRFSTLLKVYKWTRSSATEFGYSPNIQLDYKLSQFETLEKVSKTVLQSQNPQDDWTNIALDNQLKEEDYNYLGGKDITLQLKTQITLGATVESVVDTLFGKSIYGKDIQENITFSETDGEGDIVVLDYDDTIKQSAEILVNLRKNDNPDAPQYGLQKSVTIGTNRSLLNFPIISRQLSETFASDDTFKNFKINSLEIEQDNIFIDWDVTTRLNEIENGVMPL